MLLPKSGEPLSYMPICLLDTMGRMLERIIYNRLLPAVESLRGLSDRKFGFRTARSTDAIKLVSELAENAMHARGGTSKYCAFNSASWNLIRRSLAEIGVPS